MNLQCLEEYVLENFIEEGNTWMEDEERKRNAAIQVALDAGVLERCKYHEDFIFFSDKGVVNAYKLGNSQYSKGMLPMFESSREMTDFIKEVVDEHPTRDCPYCAKLTNG